MSETPQWAIFKGLDIASRYFSDSTAKLKLAREIAKALFAVATPLNGGDKQATPPGMIPVEKLADISDRLQWAAEADNIRCLVDAINDLDTLIQSTNTDKGSKP